MCAGEPKRSVETRRRACGRVDAPAEVQSRHSEASYDELDVSSCRIRVHGLSPDANLIARVRMPLVLVGQLCTKHRWQVVPRLTKKIRFCGQQSFEQMSSV
jgi:hypothetical protein